MKRSIGIWEIFGFAITSLVGTLLHYLYDFLGEAAWIAPFSGVNESTWEHMKLFFWPAFLFAILQSVFFRDREDFWCVKCRGILLGLLLIPVLFYTYNGVIGKSPAWLNIAIFFVSAAVAYAYEVCLFKHECLRCRHPKRAVILLALIGFSFILFTFLTPKLGIFLDPVTGTYGI